VVGHGEIGDDPEVVTGPHPFDDAVEEPVAGLHLERRAVDAASDQDVVDVP